MSDRYLQIRNWDHFQHYKDRNPLWIKTYTALLTDDDYLSLSSHRRAVLHGLWLAYASTSRRTHDDAASTAPRLRLDTRSLSQRLQLRVTTADIQALNHAGFLDILASTPLAQRSQPASPHARPRAHGETETEIEHKSKAVALNTDEPPWPPPHEPDTNPDPETNGLGLTLHHITPELRSI